MKLPGFPKINEADLNFGSYIHKIFENGFNAKHISELQKISEEVKKDFKLPHIKQERIDRCLNNFLMFNSKLGETLGREYKFEVELAEGIVYNGVIDRIIRGSKGGILIIDYKTGKKEKTRADLAKDKQLMGYAFAVSKKFDVPLKEIHCGHFYPLTNNMVTIKYSTLDINQWREKEVNKVWKIRKRTKEQFPPMQNNFCNYCEFQLICPLYNEECVVQQKLREQEELRDKLEADKKKLEETNEKLVDGK